MDSVVFLLCKEFLVEYLFKFYAYFFQYYSSFIQIKEIKFKFYGIFWVLLLKYYAKEKVKKKAIYQGFQRIFR